MKRLLYILLVGLLVGSSPLQAQKKPVERVYVHLDKDYYLAGESAWVKFLAVDGDCKPSRLSKVGYVEISDAQSPQIQLKLALSDGNGVGKINIPANVPSGVYELSAYTRYMRNEGSDVFFKKQIAIINPKFLPDSTRAEIVGPGEIVPENRGNGSLKIATDRSLYGNREKVDMSVSGLPENLVDLVVSVSGVDSIASVYAPEVYSLKKTQGKAWADKWLPEYEGHIVTGQLSPKAKDIPLISNISFVGGDIRYINGQPDPDGETVSFYTNGVYGPQEVVSSVTSISGETVPCRLDIVNPFSEDSPGQLPVLKFYPNEKQLMDRYVAAQLSRIINIDTITNRVDLSYYEFLPTVSYNLDEYTRFNTFEQTMLEFVQWATIRRINGIRRIVVFSEEEQVFNNGNTLVLLDGVPIFDHEEIIGYNPRNVRMINIYSGKYIFANEIYDGMISFVTHNQDLPFFKLNDNYQLFKYDCPELPREFKAPDYSRESAKGSRVPGMRHTLYWNPSAKPVRGQDARFSFFTSDLGGEFKITVEGVTSDGRIVQGSSTFSVREK